VVTVHIDGASSGNPGPAGYGLAARDEDGTSLAEGYGYIGEQTNNFAEYCALLAALELARKHGWRELRIRSDSQLLVRQVEGSYKVKNDKLRTLHRRARQLIRFLRVFRIEHVDREENKVADKLARTALKKKRSEPRGINPILVKGGC